MKKCKFVFVVAVDIHTVRRSCVLEDAFPLSWLFDRISVVGVCCWVALFTFERFGVPACV